MVISIILNVDREASTCTYIYMTTDATTLELEAACAARAVAVVAAA